MKKFIFLVGLMGFSHLGFAISPEMTSMIVRFVSEATGEAITENYSNNMQQILMRQCGSSTVCSDRQICQILNLGATFPLDCSKFSDQPVAIDPSELAFKKLLASLPEPKSCGEFYKELSKAGQNGQIAINVDGSMPTSALGGQCQQEKKNQRLPYLENKEEVLRILGYPLSDLRIDQIFQRVLHRNPADNERQWTRDFVKKGATSQDLAKVLYLSLDLIGANGRTISLENIFYQYFKQSRDLDKVSEVLLGIDKTVYMYTWNEADRTCIRSPRNMVVKNQKCGKAERQIKIMVGSCDVSYDGEYRFTLRGGQDECPEAPTPLSGPVEPGIYQVKGSFSQKCLDVRDASNQEGAKLQQMSCGGKLNQAFSLNNISGEFYTITAWHSQQCLTSDKAGPSVVQDSCNFMRSQNVRLVPSANGAFAIQLAKSGLCLDIAGLSRDNGKEIVQSSCSGEDHQDWTFIKTDPFSNPVTTIATDVSYEIVGNFSEKCIEVMDGSKSNGSSLLQWQCSGTDRQKFRFQDAGSGFYKLKAANSGKCIRAEGGKNDNGTRMVLWDCTNDQDQKIRLEPSDNSTYKFRFAHSQKCMDVAGTSADNGKEIHQWDCGSAPDQQWMLSVVNGLDTGSMPSSSACLYKHKENTKGGKKDETNFADAFGSKRSCNQDGDWKTSCKDGDGKTDEVGCSTELTKPKASGTCQYKHKKDTAGGKTGQVTALDAFGKVKSCESNSDWKTSCKDGNGDTDEVACR